MITEAVFWFSIFFIFYSYFGYPLILVVVSIVKNHSVSKGDVTPHVTLIITAYNEEKRIREKIENSLKQDYPRDRLEIIIASDCSTDETDEIVKSYKSKGVELVRAKERRGKENAQKYAVDASTGEILVFSDVATTLEPTGIRTIVKNFCDPTVGCVSSTDRFMDKEGNISGEGAYVKYEMYLRELESKVNTLVGLSGSFFAARKEVCSPWAVDMQSDFNTLINSVKKGYKGVSDTDTVGYYLNICDEKKEFSRKVRTVTRGIRVFMMSLPVLNPFRYGLFSWQLISHKLCRWLVPIAMLSVFVSNLLLLKTFKIYLFIFVLQTVFYAMAILGSLTKSKKQFLKIPSFFITVNASILYAWYKYFKGEHFAKWEPSTR